jgi:excisionase family DNA binding protein
MPDAAGQLAITSKHLYTLAGRGEISTVKLGKRRLVPADEIVRFLEQLAPA